MRGYASVNSSVRAPVLNRGKDPRSGFAEKTLGPDRSEKTLGPDRPEKTPGPDRPEKTLGPDRWIARKRPSVRIRGKDPRSGFVEKTLGPDRPEKTLGPDRSEKTLGPDQERDPLRKLQQT